MEDLKVWLKTSRGEFLFNFRLVSLSGRDSYFVTISSEKEVVYHFSINQQLGEWHIVDAPKVPDWIVEEKEKILQCIKT